MAIERYHGARTRLRVGAIEEYEALHAAIWPAVAEAMLAAGIRQYVIYRDGLDLFHHIESNDIAAAFQALQHSPSEREWQDRIAPLLDPDGPDGGFLPIVFVLDEESEPSQHPPRDWKNS